MDELIGILNISTIDIIRWCVIGVFILSAIIGAGIIIGKKLFGAHKELAKRENAITKSYEKLEEPQYKKIFFYIIEEASTEVWKKKMERFFYKIVK